MIKNKKTLARTSVGYFPPRFYHNEFRLSNSQEAAISVFLILLVSVSIVAYILFILELIYLNK